MSTQSYMDERKSALKFLMRALVYKNYRLFFGGQSLSLIGTWMQQVAMSWLVYRMTDSAFLLGLIGFTGQIPTERKIGVKSLYLTFTNIYFIR